MHTAVLKFDCFDVTVDGAPSGVEEILPGWHKYQRFGIVIQEPLGAVGASLLIQAAIAAHFAALPESLGPDGNADLLGPAMDVVYPEIYAFHVGGRHGDLGMMDFWPPYKEVFVEADPTRVLHEINGRGITALAVPEGEEREHHFVWPELRAFLWRTERVFSYAPGGRVQEPDVEIRSRDDELERNAFGIIKPLERVAQLDLRGFNAERTQVVAGDYVIEGSELDDLVRFLADVDSREYEVPHASRDAAVATRDAIVTDGRSTETYRRREAPYALRRLIP